MRLFVCSIAIVSLSCLGKCEETAFGAGNLDHTNYVPLNYFKPLPEPISKARKQWLSNPSQVPYQNLFHSVIRNPRSMSGIKALFDAALKMNRVGDILSYYRFKTQDRKNKDWPYYILAWTYLNRICDRKKVHISSMISYTSDIEKVPTLIENRDNEINFVLYEAFGGYSFYRSRLVLADLVKMNPNDAILQCLLGVHYLFGFGSVTRTDPKTGKTFVVDKEAPCSKELALKYALNAIKLNPKFSPPYYVAYMATFDKAKKNAFLRKYIEFEPDKKSATYKEALKTLARQK